MFCLPHTLFTLRRQDTDVFQQAAQVNRIPVVVCVGVCEIPEIFRVDQGDPRLLLIALRHFKSKMP